MEKKDGVQSDNRSSGPAYRPFLLVVLFIALYLVFKVVRPFLEILIFAIVLASIFYPVQVYLERLYKGRNTLAALTIIFIITFVIAIPVFLFASAMITQGLDSINRINEWIKAGNLEQLTADTRILHYQDWLQERFPALDIARLDITGGLLQMSKNLGQFVLSKGATILGNVAALIYDFFLMIFIVFFLVRDGQRMVEQGRYFSPLKKDQEDRILNGIRLVGRSVLLGTFLTALSQGIVGGIGLALVGIPGLFWGTVMGFSSLIPVVGTSLVWIPSVIYLILLGKIKSAVLLALWCIFLVGALDNFLRPFFMKGGIRMSPFYIFLAILGGVQQFGLAGILYGPLILSFAMIMLYIYGAEYQKDLLGEEKGTPPALEE